MPGPFDAEGEWLRCALHAHTTNSDGELAPSLLVRHYEWAGFDVLAITDHWVRTVEPSTGRLLVIPGTELNAQAGGPEHDAHVLALGVDADPEPPANGFAPLEEVVAWIASDDSHHPGYDSGHAWVWARCTERTQAAVLDALRKGRFYSSAGPEIHSLELDDGVLTVRCSPVASATLVAGPRRGARVNAGRLGYPHAAEILDRDAAGAITAARLERPWGAEYGRLELADASGRKAWTNPVWP